MKTQLSNFVLGLAFLSPALSFAQEQKIQPCDTYAAMEAEFAANPKAKERYDAVQKELQEATQARIQSRNNNGAKTSSVVQFTIPVVFHILHTGGPENISDQACIDALAQVNSDYAAAGADYTTIVQPFQSLYHDAQIKMMLAHKDPQGNCTSGIVRHYDVKKDWNQGTAQGNAAYWSYTWDSKKYLNIYVVASIVPQGTVTGGGIIVGYTYKPGTWQAGVANDAIVYRFDFLSGLKARSLSHEMGHWFNLTHTFGPNNNPGGNCDDDGLTDTPKTRGNFSTCPLSSTNTAYTCNSPDPSNSSFYFQNVQNFMDYSDCPLNFTDDQVSAMQAALGSSTSSRNTLWTSTNLTATDVNATIPCAPVAEFLSTSGNYTVCSGGSLTLKDFSYNGAITTYQWAGASGATAATPAASITSMVFPTMGTVNVTLTVSNAQGSSTKVRSVLVLDGNAIGGLPPVESFENAGVPVHWVVSNSGGATTWERTEDASYDGVASFAIQGANLAASSRNYLQMPLMNLAASVDKNITFNVAYAKKTNTHNDQLIVQGSKDCGGTWGDIMGLSASVLSTGSGGVDGAPFAPTGPEQWKTYTLSTTYPQWTPYTTLPSVLLRFAFIENPTVGAGNNIYIDAIKTITTTVGINELTKNLELNMYPNPTGGESVMTFKADDAANVTINVVDIYGRIVSPVMNGQVQPGEQKIILNKNGKLASGIYFIDMNYNGTHISRKLIVE